MQHLGICGDDCSLCPRYTATQSNDINLLRKVAALWYRTGFRDRMVSEEEIICHGCQSASDCAFEDLKNCASNRQINNCGECRDYPCIIIKKVFEQIKPTAERCKMKCSDIEYHQFHQSFFLKKKNLDRIHQKRYPKN